MKLIAFLLAGLVAGTAGAADEVLFGQPYVGVLPCADCSGIRTSLVFQREAGGVLGYRLEETYLGTRDGNLSFSSQGRASELGGTRSNPWAGRVRLDPHIAESRRNFLVLSPTVIELVGANGERATTGLDYKLVIERGANGKSRPAQGVPERKLFSGTLRRVLDRWEFVPCGGGPVLSAIDVSPENSLTSALTDIGLDRVDGMYLEAYGRLREGVAWLDRLNRAGTEMRCPDVKAAPVQWRAQGNEPFWNASESRGRISFTRPGQPAVTLPGSGLTWRWRDGRADRASAVLRAETESALLSLKLTPGICRDTMADAVYGWRAEGQWRQAGKTTELKGCASLGSDALPG